MSVVNPRRQHLRLPMGEDVRGVSESGHSRHLLTPTLGPSSRLRARPRALSDAHEGHRVERSGAHRVLSSELGDVRELLAVISAVSMLARSTNVGPRALREHLADVRAVCAVAPATIASSLSGPCEVIRQSTGLRDEPDQVRDCLLGAVQATTTRAIAAVDEAMARGIGARTRIALQGACEAAANTLSQVQQVLELLQSASMGCPIPIVVGDLLRELQAPRRGQILAPGPDLIELAVLGDVGAPVMVQPRTALALLLGVIACERRFRNRANKVSAVVARRQDRVTLEVRPRQPGDRPSWTMSVPQEQPSAVDDALLRLLVASVGGFLEVEEERVTLTLLCA